MVIKPNSYNIKRLRTILAYKYCEAQYSISVPSKQATLFLPIDVNCCQLVNFKVSSNLKSSEKFNFISIGTNPDTISTLTNDTVLWYENVDAGKIFDIKLQAFSVNAKYHRDSDLKQYFRNTDLEGLFIHIDSAVLVDNVEVYVIYEDLDSVG